MNDQEPKDPWQALKCAWQEYKPSSDPTLTADEQIAAVRKKMAKMHQGLNKTISGERRCMPWSPSRS